MDKYIKLPSILLSVGFCGGGKTIAMQYTIKTLKAFDFVVVISNTAQFNGDYGFLKDIGLDFRIYNGSQCNKVFKMIMHIQEMATEKQRVCIVLDDILGSLSNSKTFLKLASTYRHFNISLFMTTQFVNASMTYIRELANYVFVFDQRTDSSRKAIYQSYFGDCGTFTDFKRLFAGLKPYQFFFIDRPGKKRFKMIVPYVPKTISPKPDEKPEKAVKLRFLTENDEKCEIDEKTSFLSKFSH